MSNIIFNYKKYYLEKNIFFPVFPAVDDNNLTLKPYFEHSETLTTNEYVVAKVCAINTNVIGTYSFLAGTAIGFFASVIAEPVAIFLLDEKSMGNQIIHMVGDTVYHGATLPLNLVIMGTSDVVELLGYLSGANGYAANHASEEF